MTGRRTSLLRPGLVEVLAVGAAAAFAGGALVSQTVVVPLWRGMDPASFLRAFRWSGPATAGTVFPFELASLLLLGASTWRNRGRGRAARLSWALATAAMGGTFVLLIYFVPTNLLLLRGRVPLIEVEGVLGAWSRWNRVRTGLGLASAIWSVTALALTLGGGRPARP